MWGATQNQEGIRRAAYLIHCSLVDKKNRADIFDFWPLPFDKNTDAKMSVRQRLLERQKLEKQKQLKQQHGGSS
jgi:hypothetical protein